MLKRNSKPRERASRTARRRIGAERHRRYEPGYSPDGYVGPENVPISLYPPEPVTPPQASDGDIPPLATDSDQL